jgi:hypothetical protein
MENKTWHLASAEHIGKSHIKDNIPCQDSTHTAFKNGVYVAALSDGCSSEDLSHFGSKIICEAVCELLINQFDEFYNQKDAGAAKVKIVNYLGDAVKVEAEKQGVKELKRFSATMVFAAVKGNQVITGRFGDGTVGMIKDGKLKIFLYEKKKGEVEPTHYLITYYPGVASNLKFVFDIKKTTSDKITGFVMMSDGSEYNLISKQNRKGYWEFAPLFKKIFSDHVIKRESFKEDLQILVKSVAEKCQKFDDCSLAIMSREDVGLVEIERLTVDVLPSIDEKPTQVQVLIPPPHTKEPLPAHLDVNTYLNSTGLIGYFKNFADNTNNISISSKDHFIQLINCLLNKPSSINDLSTVTKFEMNLIQSVISNLIEINMIKIDNANSTHVIYSLL